jgi:hypothetical protein
MDEAVSFQMRKDTVIIDDDPARLLPPVLESIEGKISSMRNVRSLCFEDAENSAFFM